VQTIQQRGLDSSEAKERETVVDTGKWLPTSRGTRFPWLLKKEYCLPGAAGVKLQPRKHFIRTQKAWPNLGRGWAVFACTSLLSLYLLPVCAASACFLFVHREPDCRS